MRLTVHHTTDYRFDPPMRGVIQSLRLTPSAFEGQQVIDWTIEVDGAVRGAAFRDGAGDWIETATTLGPVDALTVEVTGEVETRDLSGVLRGHRERVVPEVYLRGSRSTETDAALAELAHDSVAGETDALGRAHALMRGVAGAIAYTPGRTDASTTAAEALAQGQGVCQDHTHAMIAAARALGIPGRYVSGYLFAPGGAAEASHAWAELFVDGLGWVGFDASNGVSPHESYIRLGSGFDAQDAAPIRGVAQGAGEERLDVEVKVLDVTGSQQQQQGDGGQSQSQGQT